MKAYLETLAYHLLDRYHDTLGKQCVVFPNRRAGVFFRHYLSSAMLGSGWLPEIHTINSFMEQLSGMSYADPVDLNFEIYRSYRSLVSNPETYDEFYYWGEMMISDFNDIDKYLVDAACLFTNMADLKDIDNVFDYLSPEQKELIRHFWSHFREKDLSPEQQSFLAIWKVLLALYDNLRSVLFERKNGYEGMIYREVAEKIARKEYPELPGENVIICGFNALSAAERQLFRHLRNSGRGEFYWDYDHQYRDGNVSEAGRFIRRNLEEFPQALGFPDDFNHLSEGKTFRVFNLPSDVLQTKKLYEVLSDREFRDPVSFNDTAVILCDEDLLQPALSSLPATVTGLNITMGYPLKNTPVFSLMENLLRLQRNMAQKADRKTGLFYFRDVLSVLNHQYIRAVLEKESAELSRLIHNRNMIYIRPSFFGNDGLLAEIFRKTDSAMDMAEYLSSVLNTLITATPEAGRYNEQFLTEREFIFHIQTRLNKLSQIFAGNPVDNSIETFTRLFSKIMRSSRIPFEGEPLQGVQLMGILETRLLDFRNLVFLSLNEGVMPAAAASLSYIPANLRFAFGMPTREDKDAIYAYYFYRLIQRSEKVDLMYNSKTEGVNTGEPSRYIYQLKYLFDHAISFETVSFSIGEKRPVPVTIRKTEEVMKKLSEFTSSGQRRLSPTSLTTYLDCPLRFYFTYVAGIREEDEVAEDVDAPGFGNLLHKTMEFLYEPYLQKQVGQKDFDLIMDDANIRKCIDRAFGEVFYKSDENKEPFTPEGRNIIVYEVIHKMVSAMLGYDLKRAPFRLIALEENVVLLFTPAKTSHAIRIGGIIDRRDESEGTVRIVDYKTGSVDTVFSSVEQLFDRDSWPSGKKLKAVLQTFIYSWIFNKSYGSSPVKPELYVAGKIFRDDFDTGVIFKQGRQTGQMLKDFREISTEFENRLAALLSELYNPDIPFRQTDDEKRCEYCPYRSICHRSAKKW